ncbi:MAG: 1-acyl-sn-glycerol-3-phosphate acyltransferase, partial [Vitreoscilla sp.]|nr:1-acyl-sn-glycerol-3-phosphate acyltransferase [Polaromonas sp.]
MKNLSAVFKLARALLHILVGFVTILLVFPRIGPEQRQLRTQVWSLGMLRRIGIQLIVKGNPALNGPLLLV